MFALAFIFLCAAAQADLFRWIDPETGSVKISNTPPPWYERSGGPAVERVPYQGPGETTPAAGSRPARAGAEPDRADPAAAARRKEEPGTAPRAPLR